MYLKKKRIFGPNQTSGIYMKVLTDTKGKVNTMNTFNEKKYTHFHGLAVLNAFEFWRAYICFDSDQRQRSCETTTKHVQNQKSFRKYKMSQNRICIFPKCSYKGATGFYKFLHIYLISLKNLVTVLIRLQLALLSNSRHGRGVIKTKTIRVENNCFWSL